SREPSKVALIAHRGEQYTAQQDKLRADWASYVRNKDKWREIRDDIDRQVARAQQEATLWGNQSQVGFDADKLRQELTASYLDKDPDYRYGSLPEYVDDALHSSKIKVHDRRRTNPDKEPLTAILDDDGKGEVPTATIAR